MDRLFSSKQSEDPMEAVNALRTIAAVFAKMIVCQVFEELSNAKSMQDLYRNTDTISPSDVWGLKDQPNKLVYSVSESAKVMGISRGTAYNLVQAGQIPFIRWGRRILIPRTALLKMLDVHSKTT